MNKNGLFTGYLQKLSLGKIRNTWHKRWFIFDRNSRKLSYYSRKTSENSNSIKDCTQIEFKDLEDVYVDHSWKNSKNVIFCIKTTQRGYTLMAPNSEAMRIWVDVIFTGAEGHTTVEY